MVNPLPLLKNSSSLRSAQNYNTCLNNLNFLRPVTNAWIICDRPGQKTHSYNTFHNHCQSQIIQSRSFFGNHFDVQKVIGNQDVSYIPLHRDLGDLRGSEVKKQEAKYGRAIPGQIGGSYSGGTLTGTQNNSGNGSTGTNGTNYGSYIDGTPVAPITKPIKLSFFSRIKARISKFGRPSGPRAQNILSPSDFDYYANNGSNGGFKPPSRGQPHGGYSKQSKFGQLSYFLFGVNRDLSPQQNITQVYNSPIANLRIIFLCVSFFCFMIGVVFFLGCNLSVTDKVDNVMRINMEIEREIMLQEMEEGRAFIKEMAQNVENSPGHQRTKTVGSVSPGGERKY